MADLKQVLTHIAGSIVDDPESVIVVSDESDGLITLELTVAPGDMGKVIGRHGRIAHAIRSVMKAAAHKSGKRVNVVIK